MVSFKSIKKGLEGIILAGFLGLTMPYCGGSGDGGDGGNDNNAPIVTITKPSKDYLEIYRVNTLEMCAKASDPDNNAITEIGFYQNKNDPYAKDALYYSENIYNASSICSDLYIDRDVKLGVYQIIAYAYDDKNAKGTDSLDIKVLNNPPVADAGNDQAAPVNNPITFDGSSSYDKDGTGGILGGIISCSWNWGNGDPIYTESLTNAPDGVFDCITTHTYFSKGDYLVTLTVEDYEGGINSDTCIASPY